MCIFQANHSYHAHVTTTTYIFSSCNMGMSDLPEIYTQARGRSPSASVYISGKSQVPMLQLRAIYSTWVIHLQEWGNCRNALRVYLYGTV